MVPVFHGALPLVAFLLLVVMPGAPGSVLAPSSDDVNGLFFLYSSL